MEKLEPISDGLPDEAYSAIDEISKALKFDPKIIVVGGGYDGKSTLRYLELFPNALVYFFEPEQKIMKLLS